MHNLSTTHTLASATRAVDQARSALATVRERLTSAEYEARDDHHSLQHLEESLTQFRVAEALGDKPETSEPDVAQIEALKARSTQNGLVVTELKRRVRQAEAELKQAEAVHIRKMSEQVSAGPLAAAQFEFAKAMDALGDAAAKIMAAHHVAHVRFEGSRHFPSVDTMYGPAAQFIRQILHPDAWAEHPYSLRPAWLDWQLAPWELPGVHEQQQQILASIEENAK